MAFVGQALVHALAVNHDIDLIQEIPEAEFFLLQRHAPGLDAAHIQNVVNQPQQMLGAGPDFFQLLPGMRRQIGVFQGDVVQADNGVHGRSDFVAHVGQEAGLGPAAFLRHHLFHFHLLFPLLHERIDVEQNRQGEDDQRGLDQTDPLQRGAYFVQPVAQVILDGLGGFGNALPRHPFRIIGMNGRDRVFTCVIGCLPHPYSGGKDDQRQQHHPHHRGTAQPQSRILSENINEEHKAQNAPGGQDQIGFLGKGGDRQQVGHHEIENERQRNQQASGPGDRHQPVLILPRRPQRGSGGIGIGDGGPHGGHVHDPADGRPAKERQDAGNAQDEQQGVPGRLAFAQFPEPQGQHLVLGQCVQQTAGGDIVPHQSGDNAAQGGQAQDHHARRSQQGLGGVEGGQALNAIVSVQMENVIHPGGTAFRQGGHGQHGKPDIGQPRHDHGDSQDNKALFERKLKFTCGMGNGFKAHKGPGGQGHDGEHPHGGGFFRGIGRGKHLHPALGIQRSGGQADGDAAAHHQRHDDLHLHGRFSPHTQQSGNHQRGHGQQHFAHVHVKPGDFIMKAKLKQAPEQLPGDQRQGGSVGPNDGHIGQNQKPAVQESVVIAKTGRRIRV